MTHRHIGRKGDVTKVRMQVDIHKVKAVTKRKLEVEYSNF